MFEQRFRLAAKQVTIINDLILICTKKMFLLSCYHSRHNPNRMSLRTSTSSSVALKMQTHGCTATSGLICYSYLVNIQNDFIQTESLWTKSMMDAETRIEICEVINDEIQRRGLNANHVFLSAGAVLAVWRVMNGVVLILLPSHLHSLSTVQWQRGEKTVLLPFVI